MKSHLLTLCAALILLPTAALAAPAKTATVAATPRNDEGAAVGDQAGVRELIFDKDDTVEGESLLPNGVNVTGRVAEDHANMIGVRGQFISHLIWLSNDI
jgi:hypothetical protein